MPEQLTGSCLCGAIRYALSPNAEPACNIICHCSNCKKVTGTHMFNSSIFQRNQLSVLSGTPKVYEDRNTASGRSVYRSFCGDCGSPLFVSSPAAEDMVSIASGTLDCGAEWWKPDQEMHVENKSEWLPDLNIERKKDQCETGEARKFIQYPTRE